jgi:hypothetical protein
MLICASIMKPFLRFVKLFGAFFFIMTGMYAVYWNHQVEEILNPGHPVVSERAAFISISLVAIGLSILWQDWRVTRG